MCLSSWVGRGLFPHQKSLEEKGDFALRRGEKIGLCRNYKGQERGLFIICYEKGLPWGLDGYFTLKIY